jgi:hypothetical protein
VAAVLDYQNQELIAFVAAPSVPESHIPVVAPAPAKWAARVTATLAKQLPGPSVPTRIFLVEKFVMKPMSGKIDRGRLPNLSHLLANAVPEAAGEAEPPNTDTGMEPGCEEVLAICRAVFETPLGWDHVFADNGGHSIVIARLAQRLRAAGWVVPVRALLSDCDTPRKVANRLRELAQASDWNAVSFGNDCIIGGFLQFHTLEDMMLKVKRTDIQDGSTISFGATVMGGAVMAPETTLLPLSIVLKAMHLPTGTYWGSPTEPVR